MGTRTLIAMAVAGALAVPFAAQASADSGTMILAQAGGAAGSGSGGAPGAGTAQGGTQGGASASPGSAGDAQGNQGGGRTAGFPPTDLTQLDKDNDGYVSREEMSDHPSASSFDQLDKDGDGKLSRDEWSAASGAATGSTGQTPSSGSTSGGSKKY